MPLDEEMKAFYRRIYGQGPAPDGGSIEQGCGQFGCDHWHAGHCRLPLLEYLRCSGTAPYFSPVSEGRPEEE